MTRLKKVRSQMGRAKCNQCDDNDGCRQRKRDSECAGVFRAKVIDQSHDQQHANSR